MNTIPCGGSVAILTDCSSVAGEKVRYKGRGMRSKDPLKEDQRSRMDWYLYWLPVLEEERNRSMRGPPTLTWEHWVRMIQT